MSGRKSTRTESRQTETEARKVVSALSVRASSTDEVVIRGFDCPVTLHDEIGGLTWDNTTIFMELNVDQETRTVREYGKNKVETFTMFIFTPLYASDAEEGAVVHLWVPSMLPVVVENCPKFANERLTGSLCTKWAFDAPAFSTISLEGEEASEESDA